MLGHVLTADEEIRAAGLDDDSFARLKAETQATANEVRKAYARGDSQPIDAALDDWLQGLGIDVTRSPIEFADLRREFLKARLRSLDAKLARNRGEVVDTPLAPTLEALAAPVAAPMPTPAIRKGGPRLADVISFWKGVSPKSHRTTDTADLMMKEFNLLHGDLALADITKAHFVAFRDQQLARVKPSTVQARLNLLRAAFTVCLEDDQLGIKDNPLLQVKIRKTQDEEKERDAFSADQLQVLYDSSVFAAVGVAATFVRDRQLLYRAFTQELADYLEGAGKQDAQQSQSIEHSMEGFGVPYYDYGVELSSPCREAVVWAMIHEIGVEGMTQRVKRHNDMAAYIAAAAKEHPNLELLLEPTLSICCFRYVAPGIDDLDSLNRQLRRRLI